MKGKYCGTISNLHSTLWLLNTWRLVGLKCARNVNFVLGFKDLVGKLVKQLIDNFYIVHVKIVFEMLLLFEILIVLVSVISKMNVTCFIFTF